MVEVGVVVVVEVGVVVEVVVEVGVVVVVEVTSMPTCRKCWKPETEHCPHCKCDPNAPWGDPSVPPMDNEGHLAPRCSGFEPFSKYVPGESDTMCANCGHQRACHAQA